MNFKQRSKLAYVYQENNAFFFNRNLPLVYTASPTKESKKEKPNGPNRHPHKITRSKILTNTISDWQTISPRKLYVYSAYFDPRHDWISVIAMVPNEGNVTVATLWCALLYQDQADEVPTIEAEIAPFSDHHDRL